MIKKEFFLSLVLVGFPTISHSQALNSNPVLNFSPNEVAENYAILVRAGNDASDQKGVEKMVETLRFQLGFKEENIFILSGDGKPEGAFLDRLKFKGIQFFPSSKEGFKKAFEALKPGTSHSKKSRKIFLYATGHGSSEQLTLKPDFWSKEVLTPEFINEIRKKNLGKEDSLASFFDFCQAGSFESICTSPSDSLMAAVPKGEYAVVDAQENLGGFTKTLAAALQTLAFKQNEIDFSELHHWLLENDRTVKGSTALDFLADLVSNEKNNPQYFCKSKTRKNFCPQGRENPSRENIDAFSGLCQKNGGFFYYEPGGILNCYCFAKPKAGKNPENTLPQLIGKFNPRLFTCDGVKLSPIESISPESAKTNH